MRASESLNYDNWKQVTFQVANGTFQLDVSQTFLKFKVFSTTQITKCIDYVY